jgi:hypothetical protein
MTDRANPRTGVFDVQTPAYGGSAGQFETFGGVRPVGHNA